ncbi:tryptophan dimethylallyltransferase 1 [Aspergillus lentulus]|nr:tryptophan dimethylallyltransferase 1 [Aspergillus lentulus]
MTLSSPAPEVAQSSVHEAQKAHKAGLQSANSTTKSPYHVISEATLFSTIDQHQYWHHVAPMLGKMLMHGDYDIHQQYYFMSIFANLIVPMLGPYPSDGRSVYKCALGSIGSVELSQNFQPTMSTARVAFEPTSYFATTGSDPCNRFAMDTALIKLKQLGIDMDLSLHHIFVNELQLTDTDERTVTKKTLLAEKFKTQNLLALDLTRQGITVKEYFYPALKSAATGKPIRQLCLDALRKWDTGRRFEAPSQVVNSYLEESQTDAYFLSFDLVDPLATRFKLYVLELNVTFAQAQNHWTLGGRLQDQDILHGLELLRELWVGFGIVEGQRTPPDQPTRPGDPPTLMPFFINFEMKPGQSLPKPKLYMPLTGIPESKIANTLTDFFTRHDMPDQARVYADNLQSYYPTEDMDVVTDHQAWLSFSYSKKGGPYLSMYYH